MEFEEIEPVDVVNEESFYIRSYIERISQEIKFTNVNTLVDGIPQSGKSNITLYNAYELSIITKRELKIIFEFDEFKKIVQEDNLLKYVIVYDEIQGSYDGWYDKVYQLLKKIFERFGFKGALIFIITPRVKNVYALREYCRYGVWTELKYSVQKKRYVYKAHYSIIDKNRRTDKLIEIEFQEQEAPKCPKHVWESALRLKNAAYNKFTRSFDNTVYSHNHSWYYSRKQSVYHCRKCPIEVPLREWQNKYAEGGN